MTERNLALDLATLDGAAIQPLGQQPVEIGFLIGVGMLAVTQGEEATDRGDEAGDPPFPDSEVDRQPGFPRLGATPGGVEKLRCRSQPVKSFHSGSSSPMMARSSRLSSIQST